MEQSVGTAVPGTTAGGGGAGGWAAFRAGLVRRFVGWLVDHPLWLFAILRRVAPLPVVRGWGLVTRYDDVREVLMRQDVFPVPFGPKIQALNDGPNFLLGMEDGPAYRDVHRKVAQAFSVADCEAVVAPLSAELARDAVAQAGGRLDAVAGLITRVPMGVCERYYGVPVADPARFADITIAMSTFMFGDPADDPALRARALAAGVELRRIVDDAMAAARRGSPDSRTVLGRLTALAEQGGDEAPSPAEIRAMLIGMITGFVPTNTMAGGHMLEVLLRRPSWLRAAREAALAADDELLWRRLWEAFRFMPLNPGPFRVCPQGAVVGEDAGRPRRIPAGTRLLVSTQSAMFDPRRVRAPGRFDCMRAASDYMMFGVGLHSCIGAAIAKAQITQTFKALLLRPGLRRARGAAGRMQKSGPFPAHLWVDFDPTPAT